MLATLCFILAVGCWFLGFINFNFKTRPVTWLCGGLMFAGAGLWIAPLIH